MAGYQLNRVLCVTAVMVAWSHLAAAQTCTVDLDAGGCEILDAQTIYAYTGDQRTISWVPDPEDMFRRDEMFYVAEIRTWPLGNLVTTQQTAVAEEVALWTPGLGGHYQVKVQACDPGVPEPDQCSDWADSLIAQGTREPWVLFIAVHPSGGGGIE